MAKNPIKVMADTLSIKIIAGRVNPKNNMFIGEKDDVTDSATSAVAVYLLTKDIEIEFSVKGKRYCLQVVEI